MSHFYLKTCGKLFLNLNHPVKCWRFGFFKFLKRDEFKWFNHVNSLFLSSFVIWEFIILKIEKTQVKNFISAKCKRNTKKEGFSCDQPFRRFDHTGKSLVFGFFCSKIFIAFFWVQKYYIYGAHSSLFSSGCIFLRNAFLHLWFFDIIVKVAFKNKGLRTWKNVNALVT